MLGRFVPSLFLASFVAFRLCSAQTEASDSQAESIQKAIQLSRAHRYAEAAVAIRDVAPPANRPQRIAFFRLRASISSGLGHSSAAASDMEAASRLDPDNLDLQMAAGIARLAAQLDSHANPRQSLQLLRSLALPVDTELRLRLKTAEMLSRANQFAEAATDFDRANHLAPGNADTLFNLALARYRNNELEAALAAAEQAKSYQDSGSLESLLGDIQEKRGDSLAAAHCYQAALTLEPNLEEHHLALARELLKHQTFDAAIVVLEQAQQLFPQSARVQLLLGLSYYLVDRSADSIHTLLAATKLDPSDDLSFRYLGEITLQDTATPNPEALSQICAFSDTHPLSRTANALCGGILLRIAEDSGDVSSRAEILRRLQQAVRIAPTDSLARCQLGKALQWSEQWTSARVQLEKCAQLDPDSTEGHYNLARVYRHLRLASLANQQTALQREAAQRQSEESTKRMNTVTRFLVLLDH
jgi:tetratricopeptide (TPR) repeat protein